MSYLIKSLTNATAPVRPGVNVTWIAGQTREVDDSLIEHYRANPAAFTIVSGPGYADHAVAVDGVGAIRQFASNPGAGWLECTGESYLKSAYPALAALCPDGYTTSYAPGIDAFGFVGSQIATSQCVIVVDYTGWDANSGKYLKRTTDYGATWTQIAPFPVSMRSDGYLIFAKNADGSVLLACWWTWNTETDYYFSRSTDHGLTWTEVGSVLGFGGITPDMCWDGANFVVFSWAENKYMHSSDNGTTWSVKSMTTDWLPATGNRGIWGTKQNGSGYLVLGTGTVAKYGEMITATGADWPSDDMPSGRVFRLSGRSYDQSKMFGRLPSAPSIEKLYIELDAVLYSIPDSAALGPYLAVVAELGTNIVAATTHWDKTDHLVMIDSGYQRVPLGVTARIFAMVSAADGSLLVFGTNTLGVKQTITLRPDDSKFRVPGIPSAVPTLKNYIYSGA